MSTSSVPDQVGILARAHIGIIAQRSAVWDGLVCDLIVKGPTGDHEVTVNPAVDTFFLTRSNDPHPIVKRLNREPPRSLTHPGALVNFVAAGDRLLTQVRRGNSGMDRLAVSILPQALVKLRDAHDISSTELRSAVMIDRPLPREIMRLLAEELSAPGVHSQLYAETLTLALLIDLLRHQDAPRHIASVKGGLAAWQLRRALRKSFTIALPRICRSPSLRRSPTCQNRILRGPSAAAPDCRLTSTNLMLVSSEQSTCFAAVIWH